MRVRGQVATTPVLAWRLQLATLRLTWLWIAVVAVGALILFGDTGSDLVVRVVRAVGYGVAAAAVVVLLSGALTWYSWRSRFGATQHVEVTDRRVMVQTGDTTVTVPWAKVVETRRTRTAWVLRTEASPLPVPRAAFSPQDAAAVDQLLVDRAAQTKARALDAERDAKAAGQERRPARKARRED
ncbi:MAG: YcxB family protein [Actinomycetales bacterium]|nr:YcxB family protein [Actinomycetales bacterium]